VPDQPPPDRPPPDAERVAYVEQVQRDAAAALLAIPGVLLVALGGKEVNGRNTGELVIRVHVAAKRPPGEVPPEQLIPAEIDGVRTDVIVSGGKRLVDAPPGAVVRSEDTDATTKRPVQGGTRLTPAERTGAHGTLGCTLWDTANHEVGFGLTNQHVIDVIGTLAVTKGVSEYGQPDGDTSSCCCNDIIGVWATGERTANSDQAVVRLAPGTKWVAEIRGIGTVAGSRPLTAVDAVVNTAVRKFGVRTGLTGGVVTDVGAIDTTGTLNILISPNDNTARLAGEALFFVERGDSGSALMDDDNKVVALLYARELTRAETIAAGGTPAPLPADGIERLKAFAWPIADVLARFAAGTPPLALAVATATAANQVHKVPGASLVAVPAEMTAVVAAEPAAFLGTARAGELRAPVGRPWFAADLPPADAVAAVREELARTATGRVLYDLVDRHREEVTRLLREDRRVGVSWHRGGGAALFQLLLRMLSRPELELPETVYGTPVAELLDRLVAVLAERGSPGLGVDLRRARAVLPDVAGRTLPEILAALDAAPAGVATDG
jgi:hypothetical protein